MQQRLERFFGRRGLLNEDRFTRGAALVHVVQPQAMQAKINLMRIDFINHTDSHLPSLAKLKRVRRKARFMNTTMKATLMGAAARDAMEHGRVASDVGRSIQHRRDRP